MRSQKRQRPHVVATRLTTEELIALTESAGQDGLTLSAFIHREIMAASDLRARMNAVESLLAEQAVKPNDFYTTGISNHYLGLAELYDADFSRRLAALVTP